MRRVLGGHLEGHPQGKLPQRPTVQDAVQVRYRVAPHDRMDSHIRPFPQDVRELLGQTRTGFTVRPTKKRSVVLVQITSALKTVDEKIMCRITMDRVVRCKS